MMYLFFFFLIRTNTLTKKKKENQTHLIKKSVVHEQWKSQRFPIFLTLQKLWWFWIFRSFCFYLGTYPTPNITNNLTILKPPSLSFCFNIIYQALENIVLNILCSLPFKSEKINWSNSYAFDSSSFLNKLLREE